MLPQFDELVEKSHWNPSLPKNYRRLTSEVSLHNIPSERKLPVSKDGELPIAYAMEYNHGPKKKVKRILYLNVKNTLAFGVVHFDRRVVFPNGITSLFFNCGCLGRFGLVDQSFIGLISQAKSRKQGTL